MVEEEWESFKQILVGIEEEILLKVSKSKTQKYEIINVRDTVKLIHWNKWPGPPACTGDPASKKNWDPACIETFVNLPYFCVLHCRYTVYLISNTTNTHVQVYVSFFVETVRLPHLRVILDHRGLHFNTGRWTGTGWPPASNGDPSSIWTSDLDPRLLLETRLGLY